MSGYTRDHAPVRLLESREDRARSQLRSHPIPSGLFPVRLEHRERQLLWRFNPIYDATARFNTLLVTFTVKEWISIAEFSTRGGEASIDFNHAGPCAGQLVLCEKDTPHAVGVHGDLFVPRHVQLSRRTEGVAHRRASAPPQMTLPNTAVRLTLEWNDHWLRASVEEDKSRGFPRQVVFAKVELRAPVRSVAFRAGDLGSVIYKVQALHTPIPASGTLSTLRKRPEWDESATVHPECPVHTDPEGVCDACDLRATKRR